MNFIKIRLFSCLAFVMSFAALEARACEIGIEDVSAPTVMRYDPFSGEAAISDLIVTLSNRGSNGCAAAISIRSESLGPARRLSGAASDLRYIVRGQGEGELDNGEGGARGALTRFVEPGARVEAIFRFEIPASQPAPHGEYADRISVRVAGERGDERRRRDFSRRIAATVDPQAQVNLAGAFTPGFDGPSSVQLDLGELRANKTRRTMLQVRATSAVDISIASRNRGQLVHESLGPASSVPYALFLEAERVPLEASAHVLSRTPRLSLRGEAYPMTVQVGDAANAASGRYTDTITIDVSPR